MWRTLKYSAAAAALILTGCQTEATSQRFLSAQSDIQTCIQTIATAEQARQAPAFKDDRDLLVYLMVRQMQEQNPYVVCNQAYIAMIQADRNKVDRLTGATTSLGLMGLGLVGVKILSDGLNDLAGSSSTARTQNNYNSRVVSDSVASEGSTISSSGEGLGIMNNTAGNDGVGGYVPRAQMDVVATENGTNSNSGELNVLPLVEGAEE